MQLLDLAVPRLLWEEEFRKHWEPFCTSWANRRPSLISFVWSFHSTCDNAFFPVQLNFSSCAVWYSKKIFWLLQWESHWTVKKIEYFTYMCLYPKVRCSEKFSHLVFFFPALYFTTHQRIFIVLQCRVN